MRFGGLLDKPLIKRSSSSGEKRVAHKQVELKSLKPELEVIPENDDSLVYLEHGWPDPICRWHSHKECELHLITASTGRSYVGEHIGDFGPGSLFLIGPHLPHNWITDDVWTEKVPLRDMVIQFDADRVLELIRAFPEFRYVEPVLSEAASGLEFIDFDFEESKKYFAIIRDTHGPVRIMAFLEFLLAISGHSKRRTVSVLQLYHENRSARQVKISAVVDHVVEKFSEPISVEFAAGMAGMSATAFSRSFQKITGNKFVEFVTRVRIGQACSMLYATDEPISAICFEVGFQNLANFNRHFLKIKGMTPTAYRNLARNELTPKESKIQ